MTITAEQRADRRNHLGASDIPALFGCDPYRTSYDVWLSKMNNLTDSPSEAAELGNRLESYVLDQAEERLGLINRNVQVWCEGLPLLANLDAQLTNGEPVEAKTSGLLGGFHQRAIWGDQGTADVPDFVAIQVHAQLACCPENVSQAHVQAFLGGRGDVWYIIPRDAHIDGWIRDKVEQWWDCHIVKGKAPTNPPTNTEMLRRIERVPDKIVEVNSALVAEYEEVRDIHLGYEKTEEKAKALLLAALGDAEWGRLDDGRMVKFVLEESKRFDQKGFREDNPALARKWTKISTSRTLRIVKAKR